jgi:hypothetical protein
MQLQMHYPEKWCLEHGILQFDEAKQWDEDFSQDSKPTTIKQQPLRDKDTHI